MYVILYETESGNWIVEDTEYAQAFTTKDEAVRSILKGDWEYPYENRSDAENEIPTDVASIEVYEI